ncbi:hypothetical protein [Terriglobus saanensis]|uniref:Response regulator receiver protein n=1 Tax=Terriglobus saanensis (strain ATCC BAA-1853 / DSM 23119 / SP1PR4) TaxID=401053 RepID=E8V7C1_TERSS|nr:hypothetical protein [Terriglobus saanensis]ADV82834.1 hypothetical protein AciPR4_2030 [Terriglobus saanensis SP1PR4]
MSTTKKQIVVFGRNATLMETRLLVLETTGFQGRGISSIADLVHTICMDEADLVLLCHTLSDEDVGSALAIVTDANPHMPILRLTFSPWAEQLKEETILNVLDGPYRLLESVKMLLSSPATTEFLPVP